MEIAREPNEVFEFFSVASNLNRLTPSWLKFKILTPGTIEMKVGAIIDYQIVLKGIRMAWRTEITDWSPGIQFVDEQIRGPYKQWVHTHRFEPFFGGTRMTDRVEYIISAGPLEPLIHPFVRRDIETIFAHRTVEIRSVFP